MEQAGVNRVRLVENRDITQRFAEDGTTVLIETAGNVIDIDNCLQLKLAIQEERVNGKLGYSYTIDFYELNPQVIQQLRRSIYGYLPVLYLNNLEQKILPLPLLWNNSPQNNNISSTYSVRIGNFVTSKQKLLPFDDSGIPWILESGFWDDDAYWIDSRTWID